MTAWYRFGTASVNSGETTVTLSVGATALNAIREGDALVLGLFAPVEIASVTDNNTVELRGNWPNASQSGAAYAIIPGPGWDSTASLALEVSEYLSAISGIISSTTELTIGTGTQTLTVPANLRLSVGAHVIISDVSNPTTNYMSGVVTGYAGTTLTVEVSAVLGSGTHSSWNVNLGGFETVEGPQGEPGTDGNDGWSPVFAVVTDGERRVLQVQSWVGGTGTPPASGEYVGATGLVSDIAQAVDIRGAPGQDGTGAGSVTQIDTGAGLTGGPITGSGTININLAGLPEETSPVAADRFLMQRASDNTLRQVKSENLPGSGAGREVLTAPRTYYVRTDGSDSNTGLTNTAGGAFRTIQRAIDVVAALDRSIFDVTIKLGTGTFATATGNVCKDGVGAGMIIILGDEANPSSTVVTTTGVMNADDAIFVSRAHLTVYSIRGVTINSSGSGVIFGLFVSSSAYMEFQNVVIGALPGGQQIRADDGGVIRATGGYTISGGAGLHWSCVNATIRVQSVQITLIGTPGFTQFASSANLGLIIVNLNTFVGTAMGSRYTAQSNAVIQTGGAGETYLPGNGAGVLLTGGLYA